MSSRLFKKYFFIRYVESMVVKVELPPLSPDTEATEQDTEATEQDDKPHDDNLGKVEKFEDSATEKKLLKE
jgi:hypothetical protein